tara:strand:- start:452 stop:1576 length:1125 start_codon:yes stop_codon:yes gene_type:complete
MNEQKTVSGFKGASSDERVRKVSRLRTLLNRPELGALGGAILVFSFFGIIAGDSGMFSVLGIVNFMEVSSLLGIVAIAAAMLMISGEFDLSIGSMIAFSGVCIAIPITYFGWPLWFTIIVTFEIAILVGLFNGLLTVKTGLPSFIVTLAMLFILRGATVALTRGISGRTQIPGLKKFAEDDPVTFIFFNDMFEGLFTWFGSIGWLSLRPNGLTVIPGLPVCVIWFAVLLFFATWILLKTKFGNWIFASGGDANGARNAGVPVTFVKIILFCGTACAATLYATIQVIDAGSADTARGLLKEFEAIIASVVGGCLLHGGYGSAIGAGLGAIIFGTVSMGIYYTGVDSDWFKVFLGLMVLVAVLFNNFIRKRVTESR